MQKHSSLKKEQVREHKDGVRKERGRDGGGMLATGAHARTHTRTQNQKLLVMCRHSPVDEHLSLY